MSRAALVLALLAGCASNQSWRQAAPDVPAAAPAVVAPRIDRLAADVGPLFHVPRRGPTVTIGLALRTSSEVDPALASFTLELVARGPDRSVEAALGELGGAVEVRWLVDGAALVTEVEAANWAPALAALAAAVTAPGFTDADVDALRAERLAAIQRRDGDPAALALHVLATLHAPAHADLGERRSIAGLSAAAARTIHAALLRAGRPALVVVGEVPPVALREAAARVLGPWPDAAVAARTSTAPVAAPREVLVVPRPGLTQTAIVLGRAVPGDGDDLALELAGATVASELRDVLRRERGETYSVTAAHAPARRGGLVFVQTQVEAAVTGAALRSLLAALADLQSRRYTGDILRLLGRAFQIERVLGQQRSDALALAIARQHLLGRPDDALAVELRTLAAMPGGRVERALAAFDPAGLQLVLVGDPAVIRGQVAPLGLGRLRLLTDAPP